MLQNIVDLAVFDGFLRCAMVCCTEYFQNGPILIEGQGSSRSGWRWKRFFLTTWWWLVSGFALGGSADAATASFNLSDIFKPTENVSDLSLKILQAIFGKIGSAFDPALTNLEAPQSSALMDAVFYVFNSGLVVMVGVVVSYSLLFSTIGAAQDGAGMQRKDGPMGVLRVAIGTSMLLPGFGGYSALQVLIMSIVIYSVNFANYMWTQVTTSFITAQVQASNSQGASSAQTESAKSGFLRELATGSANYSSDPDILQSYCTGSKNNVLTVDVLAMASCMVFKRNMTGDSSYAIRQVIPGSNACQFEVSSPYALCFGSSETPSDCGVVEASSLREFNALLQGVQVAETKANIYYNTLSANFDKVNNALTSQGETYFSGCNQVRAVTSPGSGLGAKHTDSCTLASGCGCFPQNLVNNNESLVPYTTLYSRGLCANKCKVSEDLDQVASAIQAQLALTPEISTQSADDGGCGNMQANGWATAGQYFYCLSSFLTFNSQSVRSVSSTYTFNAKSHTNVSPLCRLSVEDVNAKETSGENRLGELNRCCGTENTVRYYNLIFPNTGDGESDVQNRPYFLSWAREKSRSDARVFSFFSIFSNIFNPGARSSAGDQSFTFIENPSQSAQATCQSAQFIAAAGRDIMQDIPTYLKNYNVLTSWSTILFELGFNLTDGVGAQIVNAFKSLPTGRFYLQYALNNTMQSMYMVIEALTGLRVFNTRILSEKDYTNMSKQFTQTTDLGGFYDSWCQCVIGAFNCGSQKGGTPSVDVAKINACSSPPASAASAWETWRGKLSSNASVDFLATLQMAGCLQLANGVSPQQPNDFDYQHAGLFGMSLLRNNGLGARVDPLGNLSGIGLTMLQASVYYFTSTLNSVFNQSTQMAGLTTQVFTGAKVLVGAIVAAAGAGSKTAFVASGFMKVVDALGKAAFDVAKMGLELFLPLGSAVAGLLFVQGVILGVYLPFVAFFYYLFGVMGWLLSVVEAMVAAPLVALGVTHPEGHDLLGASEQSTMLVLGLFLRPVAMIMGLFFAIIVSQSVLGLVNEGFLYVVADFYSNLAQSSGMTAIGNPLSGELDSVLSKVLIIATLALFMMYSYIAYSVLDVAYSMIWQIPDKILRWVGGQDAGIGRQAAQSAGEIKSETQSLAGQGSQALGQASQGRVAGESSLGNYSGPKAAKRAKVREKPSTPATPTIGGS